MQSVYAFMYSPFARYHRINIECININLQGNTSGNTEKHSYQNHEHSTSESCAGEL